VAAVSLKAYPTVFMTHTAIASAIDLASRVRGRLSEIRRVDVRVPEKVATMAAAEPRWHITTRDAAQFSLPLAVATSIVNGACGLSELAVDRLTAPEVMSILAVMDIGVDPKWAGYEGGRVELTFIDGTTVASETTVAPGHPTNPMTEAQVLAKFMSLAAENLGPDRAKRVAAKIAKLATASDISDMMASTRS
jgi:2-methylcitrate dehydratase PrpD